MSDESLSDWGVPDWVPPVAKRSIAASEIAEARQTREDERARADRIEQAHARAVECWRQEAERRGEVVSVQQLASGIGLGRSPGAVLEQARMEADRADAREAARLHREGHGELQHVEYVADPVLLHPAAAATRMTISGRARRFRAVVAARRALAEAEAASGGVSYL